MPQEIERKFLISCMPDVSGLPSREIELNDDLPILTYFAGGGSVKEFMKNAQVWGEDLTAFEGFLAAVEENIRLLNKGESLL